MQKCKIRRLATWILLKSTSNKRMNWQSRAYENVFGVGRRIGDIPSRRFDTCGDYGGLDVCISLGCKSTNLRLENCM